MARPGTVILPSQSDLIFVLTIPSFVQCNPSLSALITDTLKLERVVWLKDLYKLEGLLSHVDNPQFQARWAAVKHQNKERLALFVERQLGIKVDAHALFDVQIKRLHEYKRQTLNILGVIHVCNMRSAEQKRLMFPYSPRGTCG